MLSDSTTSKCFHQTMAQPTACSLSRPRAQPSTSMKFNPSTVIIVWSILAGTAYSILMNATATVAATLKQRNSVNEVSVQIIAGVLGLVALMQVLFYPLGGLIADLWCGRYKVIMISLIKLSLGVVLLLCSASIYIAKNEFHRGMATIWPHATAGIATVAVVLLIAGFTGFQSNAVQFGLDQLQDAPSKKLCNFLHWYVWADALGNTIAQLIVTASLCNKKPQQIGVLTSSSLFMAFFIIMLFLTLWKHKSFHSEPRAQNPYGTIYRVLKFVAKHDKPIQRSALTFCDDEKPSRMEFAKQRYGGPFETEKVEDVKTFFRILVLLLAIGPIHFLYVPTVNTFFLFGLHVSPKHNVKCTYKWLLLQSGNLSHLVTVIAIPLYLFFLHSCITKKLPKILYRLGVGMILMTLSVCSMMAIETAADRTATEVNNTCFLSTEYPLRKNYAITENSQAYQYILCVPNIMIGIAQPTLFITVLEFISAQSPHTMKGLHLGIFYAIRGFFILLSCAFILYPMTSDKIWGRKQLTPSCGFYYYLSNIVIGLVAMAITCIAAKWYRYRNRDDKPYTSQYVEDYYDRYIEYDQKYGETLQNTANPLPYYGAISRESGSIVTQT